MNNTLKIAQITDLHLFNTNDKKLYGSTPNKNFCSAIKELDALSPDYIFLTGDISHDASEESYRYVMKLFDELGINTYWVPGNHDDYSLAKILFSESTSLVNQRSFTANAWRFVFLNTQKINAINGYLSQKELSELISTLKNNHEKNVALIMHHHPLNVNTPIIDQYVLENSKALFDLTCQHPEVKLVICGHVHEDYQLSYKNLNIETAPATCYQLTKGCKKLLIEHRSGFKVYQFSEDCYKAHSVYL